MKIAFYAPFKPLTHPNPSGDQIIASGLVHFLTKQGHVIDIPSTLRARWIYLKPWLWLLCMLHLIRGIFFAYRHRPDLWLTYHTYYKAPDILGPWICKLLRIKYVIFQGIYSTRPRRSLKTILGFYLNRAALKRADHIFTNKLADLKNLRRLIPEERLTYIRPGIAPDMFKRMEANAREQRMRWCKKDKPVILTAAMFRDDVKTQGLSWLIQCCANLVASNTDFHLVIAGSGTMETRLKELADAYIPHHHTFAGKISRDQMAAFYSAGDVFAFPGIRESLGMVFLEAQAASLPVVAFKNGGIPEVVSDQQTGYLIPMYDCSAFCDRLVFLLNNENHCRRMGRAAAAYVRNLHDMNENYKLFEQMLVKVTA